MTSRTAWLRARGSPVLFWLRDDGLIRYGLVPGFRSIARPSPWRPSVGPRSVLVDRTQPPSGSSWPWTAVRNADSAASSLSARSRWTLIRWPRKVVCLTSAYHAAWGTVGVAVAGQGLRRVRLVAQLEQAVDLGEPGRLLRVEVLAAGPLPTCSGAEVAPLLAQRRHVAGRRDIAGIGGIEARLAVRPRIAVRFLAWGRRRRDGRGLAAVRRRGVGGRRRDVCRRRRVGRGGRAGRRGDAGHDLVLGVVATGAALHGGDHQPGHGRVAGGPLEREEAGRLVVVARGGTRGRHGRRGGGRTRSRPAGPQVTHRRSAGPAGRRQGPDPAAPGRRRKTGGRPPRTCPCPRPTDTDRRPPCAPA